MSLETWSAVASFATLIVITATAIAALAQMRHARSSNQIAAVTAMRETMESERFREARRYAAEQVPKLIADPAGRKKLGEENFAAEFDAIRELANFFETMGAFVKLGIVDRALVCDLWDGTVFSTWKQLEPVIMIRRKIYYRGFCASFEYLAVICERSLAKTQGDHYPRGMRRITIDKRSLDAASAFTRERTDSGEAVTDQ